MFVVYLSISAAIGISFGGAISEKRAETVITLPPAGHLMAQCENECLEQIEEYETWKRSFEASSFSQFGAKNDIEDKFMPKSFDGMNQSTPLVAPPSSGINTRNLRIQKKIDGLNIYNGIK
ncbi:hypothetical protein [uncultured Roseobacter sp.]|uniref:hypothetical protein n=1 Tax=uncultured Roseobacter sp. TaxID=114847 RepID=UPI002621A155|nr:hypothetical protein [uncultured Roseobacter sp.]